MAFHGFFTKVSDFFGGTLNTASAGTAYDSAYVPNSVSYGNNIPGGFSWGTPLTDCWIHWQHCALSGSFAGNTFTDGEWFRIVNNQGRAIVKGMTSNGELVLYVSDNGTTFTIGSAIIIPADGALAAIDIHVQINSGGSNICTVYFGGMLAGSTSRAWASADGIVAVQLSNFDTNATLHYSEGMVADEDTRDLRVAILAPDAAGGVAEWDGAYTDVLERGDGLVLSTPTAAERTTFNLGAYGGPASPTAVRGVFVQTIARAGSTGPSQLDGVVRIGGVNYDASDVQVPVANGPTVFEFTNDPSTVAAWDTADFATLEAGVLSVT